MNNDKLLSENQLVGDSYGYALFRDLYERADGSRYSVRKSRHFDMDTIPKPRPTRAEMLAMFPLTT
jgi:hypothetical protein